MIDPTDCKNLKEETVIICPICLEIPRYPLIFPCGHLECHNCYSSDFALRARRWELKFFSACPICRSDVIPEKVSTAEVEFKLRPSSKVSIFYKNFHVRCCNRGCNRFILYPLLTLHEISKCPKRKIKISKSSLHPDKEELDSIINKVKLNRGRLLFGLSSNTPREVPGRMSIMELNHYMFVFIIPPSIGFVLFYALFKLLCYLICIISSIISYR